jgi:hypothetical protein
VHVDANSRLLLLGAIRSSRETAIFVFVMSPLASAPAGFVRLGVPFLLAAALGSALLASVALAQGPQGEGVASVFFVAKSENRNQVHYGIAVDAACTPVGEAPVYAYWRMLERGPLAVEPLLAREIPAYGVAEQQVVSRDERGSRVRMALRAMPQRPITVEVSRRGSACTATAETMIGGSPASLASVFVQLRWPFGIAYLELAGRRDDDGRSLRERVAK